MIGKNVGDTHNLLKIQEEEGRNLVTLIPTMSYVFMRTCHSKVVHFFGRK